MAEDIGKKGNSSELYSKAKAAMDAGTEWSITLTDGKTMSYRIIGISHDDLANGSGKAGLTFETTNDAMGMQRMNATDTNVGGWEGSELRGRLNSGDLWSLLPSNLASKIRPVKKMTDNKGGAAAGTPTATTDKLFLHSSTEYWGDMDSDGVQYEYYAAKGVTALHSPDPGLFNYSHWSRSRCRETSASAVSVTAEITGMGKQITASLFSPLGVSNHPCFLSAPPRKRGFFTSKRMVLWYNPTTQKRPTYKRGK